MKIRSLLIACVALASLAGCADAELASLESRVAELETASEGAADGSEVATLQQTIAQLETTISDLEARLAGVEGAGYLTETAFEATAAAGLTTGDIDAWNDTTAEVEGTSDGIAGSRIDLLEDADLAIEGDISVLEGDVDALETRATTMESDIDDLEAEDITFGVDLADAWVEIGELGTGKLDRIDADTTLAVPGDHALLSDALAWLDDYAIDGGATVTIQIEPGTYAEPDEVVIDHRDGHRIEIQGSGVSQTTLEFSDSDGIVVTGASALGHLGELTIQSSSGETSGILVEDASALLSLGPVTVSGWDAAGIRVTQSSSLIKDEGAAVLLQSNALGAEILEGSFADLSGAVADANTDGGFWVASSVLVAREATASNNLSTGFRGIYGAALTATDAVSTDNAGKGFFLYAGASGYMGGSQARAEDNDEEGFRSEYGSALIAHDAEADTNTGSGFSAWRGGVLGASDSRSISNGGCGYYSAEHSTVHVWAGTATGNTSPAHCSNYNGYVYRGAAVGDTDTSTSNPQTDFIYP